MRMIRFMCHKSKIFRRTGIFLILAMVLFAAGCGNKHTQKENSQQKNADSQTQDDQMTENQDIAAPEEQTQQSQDSQTMQNQQAEGQTSQGGNQMSLSNQPTLSVEEAKEAALNHAGLTAEEVTFIKEELDYEDGKPEYDIEFVTASTKYEYEISADDGAVLKHSQEPVERVSQNQQQGIISEDQAKEAVLNHAGFTPEQVTYIKVELEQDDGVTEYEIEFYADGKEYSSKVNASTGAVMEFEIE